jgi:adenine-specific DNA-methyltransferase
MTSDIPTITTSNYNNIKQYYDDILNKDKNLVVTSNDEPTPIDCVEEMINKIPESFWKKKNITILDPCCGCGNFPIVIYYKLLKYHDREDILTKMLYFNDLNVKRINVLKKIFDDDLNIYNEDFLKINMKQKFDLIVANPPYAKLLPNGNRASKNHNLIGLFIKKSLELIKSKGYLLYITPDNWMSYADRNTLISELTKLQILYLNIHISKKYFKKVGSSFTWYLIENTPSYKPITIEGIWNKKIYKDTVTSEERKYIPLYYNKIIQSILHKTIDNNNIQKFNVKTSSDLHKYTKKTFISGIQDTVYKYKLIHTPNQIVWSSKPHKYQDGFKVFISTTSYYGTFVDNCGMTQSIAFIMCKNEKEAKNISDVLNHPMYKFINNICRYGNFNNIRIIQRFPYCTDYENVYNEFNITEEEKNFIESNIK